MLPIDDYKCPISHQIMLDPVTDEAGETYEREEIESWFVECKKNKRSFTSPNTNDDLKSDSIFPAKKIKNQITQILEKNPEYWTDVYMSKKLQAEFQKAFQKKDKTTATALIDQEPRFITFDNLKVIQWTMDDRDLQFLNQAVIPNFCKRWQQNKIHEIILLAAEAKWKDGLQALIASQKWVADDYRRCAVACIHAKKMNGCKMLLHEMCTIQKIALDILDSEGNTMLHEAVKAEQPEMVELLLGMGIDSKIKNTNGLAAEEIAVTSNNNGVLQVFKKFLSNSSPGTSNNLQIQSLQSEVQELKIQLTETSLELEKQTEKVNKLSKIINIAGWPVFSVMKEKALEKYFIPVAFKRIKEIQSKVYPKAIHVLENEDIAAVYSNGYFNICNVVKNEITEKKSKLTDENSRNHCLASANYLNEYIMTYGSSLRGGRGACNHITDYNYKDSNYAYDSNLNKIFSSFSINLFTKNGGFYKEIIASEWTTEEWLSSVHILMDNSIITCVHNYYADPYVFGGGNNFNIRAAVKNCTVKKWGSDGELLKTIGTFSKDTIVGDLKEDGFFICSDEIEFKIYDSKNDECIKTFKLEERIKTDSKIHFIEQDHFLISSSNYISIWNYKTGECVKKIYGKTGPGSVERVLDDCIIFKYDDKQLGIYNFKTEEMISTLNCLSEMSCPPLSLPDGNIITGHSDGTVKIWNTKTGECLQDFTAHEKQVSSLCRLSNGMLVSASEDGTIKSWKPNPQLMLFAQAEKDIAEENIQCRIF